MKTAIAYYRVSTSGQGKSGLGLEAQREAVETVMRVFFDQHGVQPQRAAVAVDDEDDGVICEDELLAAFG